MVAVNTAPQSRSVGSECGNLQDEDRNGVWTSRDGQGSDNELGGVWPKDQRNKAGGRLVAFKAVRHGTESYPKVLLNLTRVESIRRIINRSVFGLLLKSTAVLVG